MCVGASIWLNWINMGYILSRKIPRFMRDWCETEFDDHPLSQKYTYPNKLQANEFNSSLNKCRVGLQDINFEIFSTYISNNGAMCVICMSVLASLRNYYSDFDHYLKLAYI